MIQSKKTTNKTLLKYSILLFWVAAHLYLSIQVKNKFPLIEVKCKKYATVNTDAKNFTIFFH